MTQNAATKSNVPAGAKYPTSASCPTLATLYPLFTDNAEFEAFKRDASGYLQARGVGVYTQTYQILTSVPRDGFLQPQDVQSLANIIVVQETHAGADGPLSSEPQLPMLSGLYAKFVLNRSVPWGKVANLQDAVAEEISSTKAQW